MFLCRLLLDPKHAHVRRDLADPYEMHCSLARAVAAHASQAPPRFLWRQETVSQDSAVLLVQSPVPPQWSRLGGVVDHAEKLFDPADLLREGRICRFRLRANPTVTSGGKRRGLHVGREQAAWLFRQGERLGFAVRRCVRMESDVLSMRQRKASSNRIVIQTVGFEGILEVTDPKLAACALANGLGHAKAFGLGLLSLARIGKSTPDNPREFCAIPRARG